MPPRNHLRLIANRQLEESGRLKYNYGFGDNSTDANPEPNYYYMANGFQTDLNNYRIDLATKIDSKNNTIDVPYDIDYVEIDFKGQFHLEKYYSIWYNIFGLEGVNFSNYNRTALFSIADNDKFQDFILSVERLIDRGLNDNNDAEFNRNILFVESFKLLTLSNVLKVDAENLGNVVILKTIELPADTEVENALLDALENYLTDHIINYEIDRNNNRLEVFDATLDELTIIAQNFDIIESITSSFVGAIRPGEFNAPIREYGFEIANSSESLPLIGVMDTGISMETPLSTITLQDDTFTLGGNPLIDEGGAEGHGTMSGALAALGRNNHINHFEGKVYADAKLLSIKLLGARDGYLSEKKVIELLYKAKAKYPELSIFVLTICYKIHKSTNEAFSNYTYELDKFAHETNSLIFISSGNNLNAMNENTDYNLDYFNNEHTNLNIPADSMNNITVGAAADGLYDGVFNGISSGKEFPALYTRKDHIDLEAIYSTNKRNKNLFKPDVIDSGGDYGFYANNAIDYSENAMMKVISSNPAQGYTYAIGTSLSAPLTANLAAKLKKAYPDIRSQTIKALIINSASLKSTAFPDDYKNLLHRTSGYGLVDNKQTLFSDENCVTLILEDSIQSEEQKIYPINFPEYLINTDLGKRSGILKITATLCFSFMPLQNNQLTYCPVHMAFCIFRNHTSDEINKVQDQLNSKLRTNLSWSQSAARHKSTPPPFSNVQKIEFNVDVTQLESEGRTFKLAIHSILSNQIMPSQIENYPSEFDFSLVLKIEETIKNNTGQLYDELRAINNLDIITNAENDIDLEGEV